MLFHLDSPILQKLSQQQVEQALTALYLQMNPVAEVLQKLKAQEWMILAFLLQALMEEKAEATLH